MNLNDPAEVALTIAEAFRAASFEHALYGGLLLAAYGEPRETRDADLAVANADAGPAMQALEAAGIGCEETFDGVRLGGLRVSRIALFGDPEDEGLNVLDLVQPLSDRYARVALDRAVKLTLRGREIVVLSPEDFLVFKALSTRDRDVSDAASVLRKTADALDLPLVEAEVARLAAEVPGHDVAGRWRRILELSAPGDG